MTPEVLVLFDIDGTLLIGAGSGRAATERAMREVFGTVGALAEYQFAGKTDYYTLVELLTPEGFSEAQVASVLPHYSEVLTRHMIDVMGDYELKALPGARELVQTLATRQDVLLGILTGNVPQMADLKLRSVGFDPSHFVINAYGTEARIRRELAPLALERAEKHATRHFAPEDVIIIGDTADDIDTGHSIGARVIAVCTGFAKRPGLEQHHPFALLDNLSD